MAQFRTTADYVDQVLNRAGEPTNGTSPYESDALLYLNKIHQGLIGGGLVFNQRVDDAWLWARSRHPFVLELQPKITTGTVTMTDGQDGITFSSAPSVSVKGWYLQAVGEVTTYRIAAHTAASTSADIEGFYIGTTGSKSYVLFKLDYELVPSHIYIEAGVNDKLDFIGTGSTEITATLTAGAYTPAALATHAATQVQAAVTAAVLSSTMGVSYDSVTRKFTFTSNTSGSEVFKKKAATGTNVARSAWGTFGFDYEDDSASADSHVSTYILGGVSRLFGPMRAYKGAMRAKDVLGMETEAFENEYPISDIIERNPTRFSVTFEDSSGAMQVRFNGYPSEKMLVQVPVIEVPFDLKDVAASIPKVPRKYSDILEYGAAFQILLDKEDDKAESFMKLAQAQLELMRADNDARQKRTDLNFGQITARQDQTGSNGTLRYGYDKDA